MFEPDEPTWQDVEAPNQRDSLAEWMAQEDPDGEGPSDPQAWMDWYSRRSQQE